MVWNWLEWAIKNEKFKKIELRVMSCCMGWCLGRWRLYRKFSHDWRPWLFISLTLGIKISNSLLISRKFDVLCMFTWHWSSCRALDWFIICTFASLLPSNPSHMYTRLKEKSLSEELLLRFFDDFKSCFDKLFRWRQKRRRKSVAINSSYLFESFHFTARNSWTIKMIFDITGTINDGKFLH